MTSLIAVGDPSDLVNRLIDARRNRLDVDMAQSRLRESPLPSVNIHVILSDMNTRAYSMQRRDAAAQATTDAILAAAAGVFWDSPQAEVSLDDVAARAGVTVRTVLRKFGSREGLISATAQHQARLVSDQRSSATPGDLDSIVAVLMEHYEEYGAKVLRLLAAEHTSPSLKTVADQGRLLHHHWCETMFGPWLAALPASDRQRRLAQFVAICDVQTWRLLRLDSNLGVPDTHLALLEILNPLTKES